MLDIQISTKYKKDFKRVIKQGKDINKLNDIITLLQKESSLEEKLP